MNIVRSINLRKYLLLVGIVLIIIGIILAPYDQFKTNIKPEKVNFTSQNVNFPGQSDNLTITGNLYLPQNYNASQFYPAVVLVHGINDRAERFHHMAVEFVRRNFITLAINLRGHQDSQGICTFSAHEPWDIMGAATYLLNYYNISNLGLVGHSLGGMSSIRAAHNDSRFNATVVMGPPVSVDLLISRFISDISLVDEYLPYLSFHANLSDPYERYIRSPINWVNESKPKNFFFVLGGLDNAATPEEALLLIGNASGNASAEVNVAYGNFSAGNRTMLKIYPGIDHGGEPTAPEIIVDTVLWVENALNITNGNLTLNDLIQWNFNPYWRTFINVGFLICIIPGISYICTSILNPNRIEQPTIASSLKTKKKILSLGIYAGIFIGASVLTFPVMGILEYVAWSPYNIAGFLVNILTIQGSFVAIGLIVLLYLEKRFYNATWIDFGLNKSTTFRATLIGIAISAFLVFGFFYVPNLPTSFISFPRDWGAYLLVFLNFLLVSFIGELCLRGMIQTKLYKERSRLKNWFNLIFIAIVGGLIQGVATLFIILPAANFSFSFAGFTISIPLAALVGGIVIFTLLGLLNAWIFHKTKHVLPAAIVQATMICWFLTSFMVML